MTRDRFEVASSCGYLSAVLIGYKVDRVQLGQNGRSEKLYTLLGSLKDLYFLM